MNPKEIAYFNGPIPQSTPTGGGSAYAMSSPTFVPERGEIWYSDGNTGFYAVKLTNGVWPFDATPVSPAGVLASDASIRTEPSHLAPTGLLPETGTPSTPLAVAAVLLIVSLGLLRARFLSPQSTRHPHPRG